MEQATLTGHDEVIKLKILSRPVFIQKTRRVIDEICKKAGFSDKKIIELKLAINEALANIIKHAYENCPDQNIYLYFLLASDKIEVVIRDFGKRPEPGQMKSRELNQLADRGLGLLFMKKYVDHLSFDFSMEVGTQVQFVKFK